MARGRPVVVGVVGAARARIRRSRSAVSCNPADVLAVSPGVVHRAITANRAAEQHSSSFHTGKRCGHTSTVEQRTSAHGGSWRFQTRSRQSAQANRRWWLLARDVNVRSGRSRAPFLPTDVAFATDGAPLLGGPGSHDEIPSTLGFANLPGLKGTAQPLRLPAATVMRRTPGGIPRPLSEGRGSQTNNSQQTKLAKHKRVPAMSVVRRVAPSVASVRSN